MIITTTPTIEDQPIKEYHGVIFSEVVVGINFMKDLSAGFRNFFGGRTEGYEGEIRNAQGEAVEELALRAKQLGANAIVGMKLDYEVLGSENGMIMVIGSGTAVTI